MVSLQGFIKHCQARAFRTATGLGACMLATFATEPESMTASLALLASLAGVRLTIRKHWTKEPITVDGNWRRRYAAATYSAVCRYAPSARDALRDAREKSLSGDNKIVSLGVYETQVAEGPTGLYFKDRVPTLDGEDQDISRNLMTVVARYRESTTELIERLESRLANP